MEYFKTLLEQKNKPALDLNAYTGTYKNEVYGELKIANENGKLVMHFEHHPTLTGTLEHLEKDKFLCTYSNPTYGVKALPFKITNGKVEGVTVKVNDEIDYMEYEFKKL